MTPTTKNLVGLMQAEINELTVERDRLRREWNELLQIESKLREDKARLESALQQIAIYAENDPALGYACMQDIARAAIKLPVLRRVNPAPGLRPTDAPEAGPLSKL